MLFAIFILLSHRQAAALGYGDVIITEVMAKPEASGTEYIEVYNATAFPILAQTLSLADSRRNPVPLPADTLKPHAITILCRKGDEGLTGTQGKAIGLTGFPVLNDGGDEVRLYSGTVLIAFAEYAEAAAGLSFYPPSAEEGCSAAWMAGPPSPGKAEAQAVAGPRITAAAMDGRVLSIALNRYLTAAQAADCTLRSGDSAWTALSPSPDRDWTDTLRFSITAPPLPFVYSIDVPATCYGPGQIRLFDTLDALNTPGPIGDYGKAALEKKMMRPGECLSLMHPADWSGAGPLECSILRLGGDLVWNAPVRPDVSGRTQICPELRPGAYLLIAQPAGFQPVRLPFSVSP